ncbi:MAG: hypothetical protein LBJ70_04735 [Holosporales bacterium]|nr:hypothetical protein [Holosporales bacterium]
MQIKRAIERSDALNDFMQAFCRDLPKTLFLVYAMYCKNIRKVLICENRALGTQSIGEYYATFDPWSATVV